MQGATKSMNPNTLCLSTPHVWFSNQGKTDVRLCPTLSPQICGLWARYDATLAHAQGLITRSQHRLRIHIGPTREGLPITCQPSQSVQNPVFTWQTMPALAGPGQRRLGMMSEVLGVYIYRHSMKAPLQLVKARHQVCS